ncbi:MAG: hypothetical protein E6J87_17825, partial [Deltaproteobacteria bacterium]
MNRAIFTTLLVVCAALSARSAELAFTANGEAEYDDNVFREENHTNDDVLFRLRPGVRIYEDHGDDLNFSAAYEAPVEFSVDNSSEFDEVDHVGYGYFNYHVNNQVEVFGSDNYGYLRSTLRWEGIDTDALALSRGTPVFNDQRDRVKTNDGTIGTTYRFSPRTVGRIAGSSSFFDSSRQDRARVWSAGGTADMQYKLTLKHQVGAGAGYTYQNFGDRTDIPGSATDTYRVFGSWRWLISETLSFDLTAGPAYLETKQQDAAQFRNSPTFPYTLLAAQQISPEFGFLRKDGSVFSGPIGPGSLLVASFDNPPNSTPGPVSTNCGSVAGFPVAVGCRGNVIIDSSTDPSTVNGIVASSTAVRNINAQGKKDSEVTGFVDAVLTQRWTPNLATALRYSRQQGDASGLGGTVIADSVSLSNTWDFWERWQLGFRGDWVRRTSAFDIAQTYDIVNGQIIPGGGIALAGRSGTAANSTHKVDIDTDSWGVAARITHQLFKTTSIYGQVRYDEQNSRRNTLGGASDFENFLATVGVRHVFEPIPLW